jgi:tRNA-splicing ligase RtcB
MTQTTYAVLNVEGGRPVKMWTRGVPVEDMARAQLTKAAKMPFVFKHVAAMPDVHVGIGATVGSVIPTKGAVIPAAVGVDIGCGMMAARTTLMAHDLPDNLEGIRSAIEAAVPHGRSVGRSKRDSGSWGDPPRAIVDAWATLAERFGHIVAKHPRLKNTNNLTHLGTLGTGNHFIELCLDTEARVGVPAERLAKTAAKRMAGYLVSGAFAGPYLQDQLLLPMALARGGAFTTVKISEHTRTAASLIERFVGTSFKILERDEGANIVEVDVSAG